MVNSSQNHKNRQKMMSVLNIRLPSSDIPLTSSKFVSINQICQMNLAGQRPQNQLITLANSNIVQKLCFSVIYTNGLFDDNNILLR